MAAEPDEGIFGLPRNAIGYNLAAAFGAQRFKSSRLYDWLRLKGYVAFDLPRTVTALGTLLLLGIATAHAYAATAEERLPTYFVAYCLALIIGCVVIAGA